MLAKLAYLTAAAAVVTGMVAGPQSLQGQDAGGLRPRLEARAGWAGHGGGRCYHVRASGVALGAAFQSRGPLVARVAADVFLAKTNCLTILRARDYMGQEVGIYGDPSTGPRLALDLGYGFSVLGVRSEVVAGAGVILTYTDYGPDREDLSARPWYGATATVRLPANVGLQLEVGRQQLAERYYGSSSDVLVAEFSRWEPMWRIAVTLPLTN